jgi:hypothetical protein
VYCPDVQVNDHAGGRALEVLRALHVIVREPFDDELVRAVERFGYEYSAAVASGDRRQLEQLDDAIHEWLQRMAQPVLGRVLVAFAPHKQPGGRH